MRLVDRLTSTFRELRVRIPSPPSRAPSACDTHASAPAGGDDQRSLRVVKTDNEPRVRDGYMNPSTCGHPRAQLANVDRWICRTKALSIDRAYARVTLPNFHGKEGSPVRVRQRALQKPRSPGLCVQIDLIRVGMRWVWSTLWEQSGEERPNVVALLDRHPALISRAIVDSATRIEAAASGCPVPDSGIWRCRCTENTAARPVIRAAAQLRPRRVHPGQRGGRRARRVRRDAADVDRDLRLRNGLPA